MVKMLGLQQPLFQQLRACEYNNEDWRRYGFYTSNENPGCQETRGIIIRVS